MSSLLIEIKSILVENWYSSNMTDSSNPPVCSFTINLWFNLECHDEKKLDPDHGLLFHRLSRLEKTLVSVSKPLQAFLTMSCFLKFISVSRELQFCDKIPLGSKATVILNNTKNWYNLNMVLFCRFFGRVYKNNYTQEPFSHALKFVCTYVRLNPVISCITHAKLVLVPLESKASVRAKATNAAPLLLMHWYSAWC